MSSSKVVPILSTAGAIPVKNDKGEISMQKVKVNRYVSGKRPDYATTHSSSDDSDEEEFIRPRKQARGRPVEESPEKEWDETPDLPLTAHSDRRLKRLLNREVDDHRIERHRHIHEPEIIGTEEDEVTPHLESEEVSFSKNARRWESSEEEDEAEDLDEDDIERRRMIARQKAVIKQQEEELLAREEEKESEEDEDDEASEYEEYTDSEEETGPRLKPIFVSKKERITIAEKEKELQKQKLMELEAKKLAEERRRYTLKVVEEEVRKEMQAKDEKDLESGILSVLTDAEDEELEYETWKLRELKRNKRDRDEREAEERERQEIERIRNMTEEERRLEFKNNPKEVTNKAPKGKYKFLQKYYHRGAFYLDEDKEVFKRDFAVPTLEDHFDKTVLPKVMQVKNFGRSGRTKYTHLVDQDTSQADAPWATHTAQNLKFYTQHAGGVKQVFERPALKKNNNSGT
ncbi:microfibrillar-associated protein 1-like [Daphnia pulex]|uniref:microfibrillar-associated protein 1-like n=1 Tax=Daphnia pulex TaxID=6669 RepID=UPI001EE040BB|nr:microfibrillar-associated protein 1-like [Daphnia pulex]XP_046438440.1 microfibrillar-associated protein 1-like [Daphnia pulex]